MSLVRGLTEMGGKAVKKTAPFYSAVDEALANLKRPKGTGAEFLTEVLKQPGVKKAEIADRKLEQAFKAKGKITKEEAQQILKDNPPPKLRERELTEISDDMREAELQDKIETSGYDSWDEVPSRIIRKWNEEIDENLEKYGDYKTPGGKNYREILLKLPEGFSEAESNRLMALEADMRRSELPAYKMQELLALQAKKQNAAPSYQSSHWREDPNVLAHMRVQDRTGPNGEKILHVEEIQSDWHQAGRKKGYASEDKPIRLSGEVIPLGDKTYGVKWQDGSVSDVGLGFDHAQRLADKGKLTGVVPDAPFKKNWHELAMKRLLNYAADNGYDSIAITPGAEQAKRYDLSKHLNEVRFDPRTGNLVGDDHQGKMVIAREGVTTENLPDYIGKEGAQKILQTPVDEYGVHVLRGADLEVGGEGMKGFYDKILPDYLNTFGKPYGAQVQPHSFPISTRDPLSTSWGGGQGDHPFITVQDLNEPFDGMVELMRRNAETGEETLVGRMTRPESERRIAEELQKLDTVNQTKLHNFPITPEMREQIKQKGLPLYQQIGIPTAGAGAASQALQPEEEQGLSGGGMVNSAIKQAHLAKLAKMRQEMAPRAEAIKNLIAKDANAYLRDVVPNSLTNPEIEAEIARMAARAKAAGQQEGVLPTAQRDANLGKFLKNAPVKERLFHATDNDFSDFQVGSYLTNDPNYAAQYGNRVMPVHMSASKIKQIPDEDFRLLAGRPSSLKPYLDEGYDALASDTGGDYIILDPRKVKSSTGNRGTYDINDPDITKAIGGSVKRQVKKADGGAINYNTAPDMSDGGRIIQGAPFKHGGKVNMTTNRDAMFMELSNKKLKRK